MKYYRIKNISKDSLESIPSTTTILYFGSETLRNKTGAELAQVFAALPRTITTLGLKHNQLDNKTGVELAQAFAALPPTVTNLDLGSNRLAFKTGVELAQAFAALPPTVTTLELGDNSLHIKTGAELAQAFAAIPRTITGLYLTGNDLGKKTSAELAQAFAALPPTVTTLDLSGNRLDLKTGAELAQAFAAIPPTVTALDLTHNGLDNKTGAELAQAFAAIPRTITTLNLMENYLDQKTGPELAQAFAALPRTITTLNLMENNLGYKKGAELAQIVAAIPPGVEALDLSGDGLLDSKTEEELESIFENAPLGCSINIDDVDFTPAKTVAKKLLEEVSNHIYKEKTFIFDDIKLPQQYATDLNKFVQLIDALKKQNTAISNFTRALLITQQIEHPFTNEFVNEKTNKIGYFEKAKIITSSAFYSLSNFLYNTKQGDYIADNEQCQIELCKEAIRLYYEAYDKEEAIRLYYAADDKEEAKQSDPNLKTLEQKEENKTPLQKVIQHLMSLLLYDMNEVIRENNEISSDYKSLIKYTNEVCEKINAGPAMASKEYNQKRLNKPSC